MNEWAQEKIEKYKNHYLVRIALAPIKENEIKFLFCKQ